jgi:hypothetical protein
MHRLSAHAFRQGSLRCVATPLSLPPSFAHAPVRMTCGKRPLSAIAPAESRFETKSMQNTAVERGRVAIALEEQEMMALGGYQAIEATAAHRITTDIKLLGEELLETGLLRFNSVLSAGDVRELMQHVNDVLGASIEEVSTTGRPYLDLFGPVMCREKRFDLLLPLGLILTLTPTTSPYLLPSTHNPKTRNP